MEVGVKLCGCDANTCFNVELTDEELMLLEKISQKSKATSQYNCMPTLLIQEPFTKEELGEDDE